MMARTTFWWARCGAGASGDTWNHKMATIVQHKYVIVEATSPLVIALPGNATAGNTIILVIGWYDANGVLALPTPTDANGTIQTIFNPGLNASDNAVAIFYVPNCSGGVTHSITVQGLNAAPDGSFYGSAALYEVSGLTSSPLDKVSAGGSTVGAGGWTTQATGTTGTLSQANEWALVACTFDDNPGVTNEGMNVPSGYTVDPNIAGFNSNQFQNTSSNVGLQVGWEEITATTALNPSFFLSASQSGLSSTYAVIATFKEPAAASLWAIHA